jgi:L-2,4-diaminobutyrate transaminase
LAVLQVIADEDLVERARVRGGYLLDRLRELAARHEQVGEVRGRGLIAGIEFSDRGRAFDPALKVGARVYARALEHGLITRALPSSDTIAFSPPFVVSTEELDEMVALARRALDDVAAEL